MLNVNTIRGWHSISEFASMCVSVHLLARTSIIFRWYNRIWAENICGLNEVYIPKDNCEFKDLRPNTQGIIILWYTFYCHSNYPSKRPEIGVIKSAIKWPFEFTRIEWRAKVGISRNKRLIMHLKFSDNNVSNLVVIHWTNLYYLLLVDLIIKCGEILFSYKTCHVRSLSRLQSDSVQVEWMEKTQSHWMYYIPRAWCLSCWSQLTLQNRINGSVQNEWIMDFCP